MPGMIMNLKAEEPSQSTGATSIDQRHDSHEDSKHGDVDADHDMEDVGDGKPKKKRRVVKISDKKYECPQAECGKSYSRAEHLYRHQLNHSPKQIYRCDFPGCDRHFVRADLCARHKERHTAKGSHLHRKDSQLLTSQRTTGSENTASGANATSTSPGGPVHSHAPSNLPADAYAQQMNGAATASSTYHPTSESYAVQATTDVSSVHSGSAVSLEQQLPASYTPYPGQYNNGMLPPHSPNATRRFSNESYNPRPAIVASAYGHQQQLPINSMPHVAMSTPQSASSMYQQQQQHQQQYNTSSSTSASTYRPPTSYPNMTGMPPYGMSNGGMSQGYGMMQNGYATNANGVVDYDLISMTGGYAMPVFGLPTDGLNRSPPLAMDDILFAQLMEGGGVLPDLSPPSPPLPEPSYIPQQMQPSALPRNDSEAVLTEPPQQPIAAEQWDSISPTINGLDLNMRESIITDERQVRIVHLIRSFDEIESMPERKSKHAILAGDYSDPSHPLSVHMLRTYLSSYWLHIYQQMPILHRPTFNAETCPDLLLLAMMCLGACCLERSHKPEVLEECYELSLFVAYHVRWEVFKDNEFKPTAKLWTFQAMLLLELFEKMYSTRSLHERAHIHHATTLTVMRRGSSLIGRSATDTTPNRHDPTRTPPGPDGSINTSGQNTGDASWNRWITAEATRRVAFAAFIIDSTHATLFGHSAVMALHDIRLTLPCDEALWSATSSAEVQRVEASLAANGFKPVTFLDGLKKTLAAQKVRTNTFGRVILMAGLLNVSWHLNQRDLQVSSLNAKETLGSMTRWRTPLTRAFDQWRRDFDDSLSKNDHWLAMSGAGRNAGGSSGNASSASSTSGYLTSMDAVAATAHRDNVVESRTCLHSLAHMAMHVDIVDCEVFAGAERALGRVVTEADRSGVQRRMREAWAPSARARDATFYAIRFLCEVLIPDEDLTPAGLARRASAPMKTAAPPPAFTYSARDDYLLNRPWILYFACMIVWSYGYALDGPLAPDVAARTHLATPEARAADLHQYLVRMGGIASPDDLPHLTDRNACLGLLLLLRECFQQPRWELLHEASELLGNCVELLMPSSAASEVKTT